MNQYYLLLIFIISYINCFSQETNPFEIRLDEKNNVITKIDTISYTEFTIKGKPLEWTEPKTNQKADSIYKYLRKKFPESFKDSLSGLILKGKNESLFLDYDTSYYGQTYTILDFQLGFLFIHKMVLVGEEYILFNPKNRYIKSVWGYSNFIDSSAIFAVSNNEALNFAFLFQSLNKDNFFAFYPNYSWSISNYYYSKNKFYFEFSPDNIKESKKYLRITFKIL